MCEPIENRDDVECPVRYPPLGSAWVADRGRQRSVERAVFTRDDRRLMRPVFVQRALIPEHRIDELLVEFPESAEHNEQVIARDDRGRIELQAAEGTHQLMNGFGSDRAARHAAQSLTGNCQLSCALDGHRAERVGYPQTSAAVSTMRRSLATSSS